MTETDQLPDIDRLEEGHEVSVYYRSKRSGNMVDRTGTVSESADLDSGRMVRVHTGERGPYKHQYVTLVYADTEEEDKVVAAFSETVDSDEPAGGDPPVVGEIYTVRFTVSRRSFLGEVDRVVREDGPGPFLVTDGGVDV